MYRYKRDQGRVAATAIGNLSALLYAFGSLHASCSARLLGQPVTAKAVMPSLRGNHGTVLVQMSDRFLPTWPRVQVTATGNYGDDGRTLDPAHFQVDTRGPVADGHIIVLEDTWVTGGHSQALAVALKHAGAATVTVLPICRLLSPTWQPNADYRQTSHPRMWSAEICPVTGASCPQTGCLGVHQRVLEAQLHTAQDGTGQVRTTQVRAPMPLCFVKQFVGLACDKALRNVSVNPWRIGAITTAIVAAALVLLHFDHARTTCNAQRSTRCSE